MADLLDGIYKLAMSDESDPVNIGNPREMTICQFAELIIKLIGSSSELEYHPLPVDDPKTWQPNIDRAKNILGWEPRVKLEEGLGNTIEWFKKFTS